LLQSGERFWKETEQEEKYFSKTNTSLNLCAILYMIEDYRDGYIQGAILPSNSFT